MGPCIMIKDTNREPLGTEKGRAKKWPWETPAMNRELTSFSEIATRGTYKIFNTFAPTEALIPPW